jgi:branched-chain amino acid transport system substrate-binding protein
MEGHDPPSSEALAADVLTFLIADVRGYTRYTQEHGDEEAGRLAATFAQLVEEVVEGDGGRLLELRGDEALSVFRSARQALRAAVDLQRRFRARVDGEPAFPLGIGVGLDAGEAVPVGEGYRGAALNVAARLCSLAAPGESLATETVVSLARRVDGVRYLERRPVQVKGVEKPVRLIEVAPEEELPPVPVPSAPVGRRRRSRVLLIAPAVALALAVAAVAVLVLSGGKSESRLIGNAVASIGPRGQVGSYTEVGTNPTNLEVGEGAVWVLNADDQTVSRIDPKTHGIAKTFSTGRTPTDIAVGEGNVWIGNAAVENGRQQEFTDTISQVDPQSAVVTRTLRLAKPATNVPPNGVLPGVSQLAVGAGSLWAINPDFSIWRIDSGTGRVTARIRVRAGAGIAAARDAVWFVGDDFTSIRRIDPRTNRVGKRIAVGASFLADLALGAGSVWASAPQDGVVWRIDPRVNPPVQRTINVGRGAASIAFAGGALWVANTLDGRILRIDPRTNAVTRTTRIPGSPLGIAAARGSAFVSLVGGTRPGALPSSACGAIASGGRKPDVLIASDLPLRGDSAGTARSMVAAVLHVLRASGFRAGAHTVGYQSCDDSTSQINQFDFFKCSSNAKAYAAAKKLVGLIGTYNSGCAFDEIPIVNRGAAGPLPMVSPANTYIGLTRAGPGTAPGEPGVLYPTGVRNFARVVAPDDLLGAGQAVLVKQLGIGSAYVLKDVEEYGASIAGLFVKTGPRLGIRIAGRETWDPRSASYAPLADRIARSGAKAVVLAGLLDLNGAALVKALRARLGRRVVFVTGEGFPVASTLQAVGRDALGMYVTTTAVAPQGLPPAGSRFVREFAPTQPGGIVDPYVLEAAQATEVLLGAIARSDGTRRSVLAQLRGTRVRGGILGSFRFDRGGDKVPGSVSVYRITGRTPPGVKLPLQLRGSVFDRTVSVPGNLLR